MTRRHESWICVVSCRCADGREVRVKLATQFRHPCAIEQAQARARAVAVELERELSAAESPESVVGREQALARRLLRRASPAHDILSVEVSFPERGSGAASAGSGSMAAMPAASLGSAAVLEAQRRDKSPSDHPLDVTDSGPVSRRPEPLPAEPARRARALIVHGDVRLLGKVIEVLNEEFDVLTATSALHGESIVQSTPFDVVLVAHPLRDGSGIALLREAMSRNADTTCFVLSTRAGSRAATQAMRDANFTPRVLIEPLEPADVLAKARTVLTLTRMREAAAKLQGRRANASEP